MYIVPNSTLILLRDCPLDDTYDHTIYFNSQADQYNYFYGLRKFVFTGQSYTRVNRGYVRLEKKSDDLYDCNYLMFQNTSYGNKWFYAFITSVEYVNDEVCEVRYEIDHLQTWHFDYTLKECFVEREHSATDVIGENLVPEGLEQGEYIQNGESSDLMNNMIQNNHTIVVLTTFNNDEDLTDATGKALAGVYSGLNVLEFDGPTNANIFLSRVVSKNKIDGVLAIYMSPAQVGNTPWDKPLTSVAVVQKGYDSLNGYVPRNKKLFTYPYNLLHLVTDTGSSDLRFENFSTSVCAFNVYSVPIPSPTFVAAPIGYQGEADANLEYRVTVSEYPQCAWVNDTYAAWLAQNTGTLAARAGSAALSAGVGIAGSILTGNPMAAIGGITSAVNDVFSTVGQMHDISTKAPQSNGTQTTMADFSCGAKTILAKHYTIKKEFAAIIDDFFDMFGYATHRVKVPNRNVRPHWTYTKTKGCIIVGGIPADASKKIISIYNNGITFWKNGNEVGNYSLDNRV